ncbi:MAG: ABC transporter permease [Gammaproteobacteria bacterium]|nr:ABC transporter permease [Gammaproteobacteria bacterium]
MSPILIVAGKEFTDGLRNRWVFAITIVFAVLALGISYFGSAASGLVGFSSLATLIVSLASLAIFLIPLIALLLAYDCIVGENEQGTLLLLMTYPVTAAELLLGKFIGFASILAVSTVLGFGGSGLVIAMLSDQVSDASLWNAFGFFILSATLLGWVFIALAQLLSVMVSEKSRAAGLALVLWFWFVLIFDMVLLGLLVMESGSGDGEWLSYLLLLNPADIFRIANLASFEAVREYTGLAVIATGPLFNPAVLLGILVAWICLPLGLAITIFQRKSI